MAVDLTHVSDAELHRELARCEQQMRGVSTGDFYFFVEENEKADKLGQWLYRIVHRRHWHYSHALRDIHFSRYLVFPPGFTEVQQPTLEFNGSVEDGKRLLKEYGYVELDRSGPHGQGWQKVLFATRICVAGETIHVDCMCDTVELHALMGSHAWDRYEFATFEKYREWIASLAPRLFVELRGVDKGRCLLCVMDASVAQTLSACLKVMC